MRLVLVTPWWNVVAWFVGTRLARRRGVVLWPRPSQSFVQHSGYRGRVLWWLW